MFRPNTTGQLKASSGYNGYGEPIFGPGVTVPVAIIHLLDTTAKTSVRTDSSATRGNAEEEGSTAKILFTPTAGVKKGMKFDIRGVSLRVMSVEPRIAVGGRHDHDECLLTAWTEQAAP